MNFQFCFRLSGDAFRFFLFFRRVRYVQVFKSASARQRAVEIKLNLTVFSVCVSLHTEARLEIKKLLTSYSQEGKNHMCASLMEPLRKIRFAVLWSFLSLFPFFYDQSFCSAKFETHFHIYRVGSPSFAFGEIFEREHAVFS
jgi:hypothetical protein